MAMVTDNNRRTSSKINSDQEKSDIALEGTPRMKVSSCLCRTSEPSKTSLELHSLAAKQQSAGTTPPHPVDRIVWWGGSVIGDRSHDM